MNIRKKLEEEAKWQHKCGEEIEEFLVFLDGLWTEELVDKEKQEMNRLVQAYDCIDADIIERSRYHKDDPNSSERISLGLWLRAKLHKMIWEVKK